MLQIGTRKIGIDQPPFVIVEIGINHHGDIEKAKRMIRDAANAGAECVKFQCHILDDEMIPNDVVPGNADTSIWNIMESAVLSEAQERELKNFTEELGLIFLSTPFSRAAADRLQSMDIPAYKIGSGECNNYPLIEHIARFGKPVILSTGMNDLASIEPAVKILEQHKVPYALLHCTSMYPTPYERVRLGALDDLRIHFPGAVLGLSDHSMGIYTCLASVALGACILEKHFTSDLSWPGPDIPISITPSELHSLIEGSLAIHQALGGKKAILKEEQPTIDFAYASVVTIAPIKKGEHFSKDNLWVKRPGTGPIRAHDYTSLIGKEATQDIDKDTQVHWEHVGQ